MTCRLLSKRITLLTFAFLLCETSLLAWVQAPAPAPAKSCLWRISSKEGTVYLLGSIHLLKQSFYPLNKTIENAFENSGRLALEVNLDEMSSADAQKLILSKGLLADGKTLQQMLSKESFELVSERLNTLGLRIDGVQRLKPWFLMLTMTVARLQQLGYDPAHGIDKYFFDKAKKSNKQIASLETAEFQINLLDAMPTETQEAALLQTLKDLEVMEKEFDQIIQAWSAGDTRRLEDSLLESFKEYPDVYETIVSERNKNWLPKIEEFLRRKGNTLVVVGAAHLVGASGVVELLRKEGYMVEQQ